MVLVTQEEINTATLEAIYWWNRNEWYYHKYFSRLDELFSNKKLLVFFKTKVFEAFLKEYSVRRNIGEGEGSVQKFLNELFRTDINFVQHVKDSKVSVIDDVSLSLKNLRGSTRRETKSLLSKIAFLINPTCYSLYDSYTKASIYDILKKTTSSFKKKELESYSFYLNKTVSFLESSTDKFDNSFKILDGFNGSPAHDFFKMNQMAFKKRILDKFLWIYHQNKLGRAIFNDEYLTFYSL